jgi:hypothetical protein
MHIWMAGKTNIQERGDRHKPCTNFVALVQQVLVLLLKVCLRVYRTHEFNCGFDLYLGGVVFYTEIEREFKT